MLTRQSLQWWMQRHDVRLTPEAIGDLLGLASELNARMAAEYAEAEGLAWKLDRAGAYAASREGARRPSQEAVPQKPTKADQGKKRTDFFCLASSRQYEVVELKRPGQVVGQKELDQIRDYVFFLREHAGKTNDPKTRIDRVGGILVYSDMRAGVSQHVSALYDRQVYVRTWDNLLNRTEELHREFLEVVKGRAPAKDPRIRDLGDIADGK